MNSSQAYWYKKGREDVKTGAYNPPNIDDYKPYYDKGWNMQLYLDVQGEKT